MNQIIHRMADFIVDAQKNSVLDANNATLDHMSSQLIITPYDTRGWRCTGSWSLRKMGTIPITSDNGRHVTLERWAWALPHPSKSNRWSKTLKASWFESASIGFWELAVTLGFILTLFPSNLPTNVAAGPRPGPGPFFIAWGCQRKLWTRQWLCLCFKTKTSVSQQENVVSSKALPLETESLR